MGADVNWVGSGGDTPLLASIRNGHSYVALKLIRDGANVDGPKSTLALPGGELEKPKKRNILCLLYLNIYRKPNLSCNSTCQESPRHSTPRHSTPLHVACANGNEVSCSDYSTLALDIAVTFKTNFSHHNQGCCRGTPTAGCKSF